MPNARKKGQKYAGAFVDELTAKMLDNLASKHGYKDRSALLRALYDATVNDPNTAAIIEKVLAGAP